ncbi:PH domain-containing protein [Corynebacterium guangdongense]|uniref:Membrane protein n=1 Tax=Corynebacterium guangdongense TaxID=1783348 RepID=A0ABU1ZV00_9CORY|nr:PH domain-containing protein [Corynebacterium guangdongense]MDR7328610.1 putative membrane protein [Corynebacterium guangdongense]WJZ17187.1 Bacterial membrane flanked domain protein [Corynebacterium guangdongense]
MRRVHRLTPLLRFWTVILALLAVVVLNFAEMIAEPALEFFRGGDVAPLAVGLGVFVLACVCVWAVSWFWWKATGYELREEELALQRGVLSRQLRTARYDRIQAVDVVESVIARIFRVATVRVEIAGGASSAIEIAYLDRGVAEELRRELLGRVQSRPEEPAGAAGAVDRADEGLRVPLARALAGAGLQWSFLLGLAFTLFFLTSPLPTATALAAVVGILPGLWAQIDASWKFTATHDTEQDLLNLSYGLADRRRQAIPLARIHGVRAYQPMLWRPFGWWRVTVTVAGYGAESNKKSGTSRILPVGTREQAMDVLTVVTDLSREELETRARPEGHARPDFTSPTRARLVSPVDLSQQAVTMLGDVAITHTGRLSRSVAIIHTSHIQELTLRRGPLQQLLRLCSVRFDLVAGPVRMAGHDLDVDEGHALLQRLRTRELPSYHGPL